MKRTIFGVTAVLLIFSLPIFAEEKDNVLSLSLDEVSRLALKNNFDIQVYQLDRLIKKEDILSAQSVYDTTLEAVFEYDEDRLESSSSLAGTRSNTVEQAFNLSKKLPLGTVLSLGAEHKRGYSDSAYSSVNPYHESSFKASLRQPLLKDALGIQDRNNVKITQLDIDNSGYTSCDKIEEELADAQKAYYLLVSAQAKLGVQKDIFEASGRLYARSRNNFDIGIMEEAELFAIEANLKERERDLELAGDSLNYAMNELRFKLNLPQEITIKCKEEISFPGYQDINEIKLMNEAFSSRRDYQTAKNKIRSENLALEMKKNTLYPQLDVVGTFKKNNVDAKFSDSWGDIFEGDNPEYTALIEFKFPLENREARAEFNQKKLEKAKAIINLKKEECLILTEVNNAISRLYSTREAAKLQEKVLELQLKKYLAEEKRFNRGRSDTDRFIRYQQDFLKAKLEYLDSLSNYIVADIDLKLVLNTLLKETEG